MMILYVIYHGHGGHGQVTTSTHGDEVPADSGPRHNFVIRVMSNILMLIQFSTRIRSTFRLMGAIHNVQQSSVHIHKQEQLEIMILTECYKLFHLNFPFLLFHFFLRDMRWVILRLLSKHFWTGHPKFFWGGQMSFLYLVFTTFGQKNVFFAFQ